MSQFLHDLANVVAIIQGKVRQADQLASSLQKDAQSQAIKEKLRATLTAIERLERLLSEEKLRHQNQSLAEKNNKKGNAA